MRRQPRRRWLRLARKCVHSRVLIPCGGEPVSGESGRKRAANDPTKETRASRVDDAALDSFHEIINYYGCIDSEFAEWKRQLASQGIEVAVAATGRSDAGARVTNGVKKGCGQRFLKRCELFSHGGRIVAIV